VRELIDCHIHTARCGHATGTVAQMVSAAVFGGLTGIVMTEHLPLPDDLDPQRRLSMHRDQLESYVDEVTALASRVQGLEVVLGAEADWLPDRSMHVNEVVSASRALGVRVVLGSVHFIDGWAFDDPNDVEEWTRRDVDEVYERYFTLWCDAARSGLFDVMAHPDLPKKFGHRPSRDPEEFYRAAAGAAAEGAVGIEVSTAGLRKPVGELYPADGMLTAFAQAGVPASVGSDAHSPAEVGFGIATAYDGLVRSGYTQAGFPLGEGEWRWIDL
jgi:histidinol-phosphatase (PHP family)